MCDLRWVWGIASDSLIFKIFKWTLATIASLIVSAILIVYFSIYTNEYNKLDFDEELYFVTACWMFPKSEKCKKLDKIARGEERPTTEKVDDNTNKVAVFSEQIKVVKRQRYEFDISLDVLRQWMRLVVADKSQNAKNIDVVLLERRTALKQKDDAGVFKSEWELRTLRYKRLELEKEEEYIQYKIDHFYQFYGRKSEKASSDESEDQDMIYFDNRLGRQAKRYFWASTDSALSFALWRQPQSKTGVHSFAPHLPVPNIHASETFVLPLVKTEIAQFQARLDQGGINVGPIDGIWGNKSIQGFLELKSIVPGFSNNPIPTQGDLKYLRALTTEYNQPTIEAIVKENNFKKNELLMYKPHDVSIEYLKINGALIGKDINLSKQSIYDATSYGVQNVYTPQIDIDRSGIDRVGIIPPQPIYDATPLGVQNVYAPQIDIDRSGIDRVGIIPPQPIYDATPPGVQNVYTPNSAIDRIGIDRVNTIPMQRF